MLDAESLLRIVAGFRDALDLHRTRIDSLNVYPVPDGDTGTNMALTLGSVVQEMEAADDDLESVCRAIAHGALMGARGNSGVIMAQILRGISGVVRESAVAGEHLDANVVAQALCAASKGAYSAVGNPVEGTILTVMREASEAAEATAAAGASLSDVFNSAGERGYDALARTPEMLDVLATAGVVDAGGAGLMLLFDAGRAELCGHPMPEPQSDDMAVPPSSAAVAVEPDTHKEPSIADLRYEVMFLLDTEDEKVDGFKKSWAEIGDSIVVVGGDGVWNCHVHTDDIGAAIEAGIAVGRPHRIRVTDLLEEVAERDWVQSALKDESATSQVAEPTEESTKPSSQQTSPTDESSASFSSVEITEPEACSVVAVGSGRGVVEILSSMGAHRVVAGGQSMNPSTAELLNAVDSLPTGQVVVLPNNKNIIAVAKQLDAATDRSVSVVPTTTVMEGIACLMSFDPHADSRTNSRWMTEAASDVTGGEITQAVRDATSDAGEVRAGDWLGIGADGIMVVAADEIAAATGLLSEIISDYDHELLTIIIGADATPAAVEAIVSYVQQHHPDLEVEMQPGGQPLYPYYFGLE